MGWTEKARADLVVTLCRSVVRVTCAPTDSRAAGFGIAGATASVLAASFGARPAAPVAASTPATPPATEALVLGRSREEDELSTAAAAAAAAVPSSRSAAADVVGATVLNLAVDVVSAASASATAARTRPPSPAAPTKEAGG